MVSVERQWGEAGCGRKHGGGAGNYTGGDGADVDTAGDGANTAPCDDGTETAIVDAVCASDGAACNRPQRRRDPQAKDRLLAYRPEACWQRKVARGTTQKPRPMRSRQLGPEETCAGSSRVLASGGAEMWRKGRETPAAGPPPGLKTHFP